MATTTLSKGDGAPLDLQNVRAQFPALASKQVYMDNAGGSQVLKTVIESISDYFSANNVQLGASYPVAQKSTALFNEGHAAAAKYVNASPEEVVLGASTTQLFRNLSTALKVDGDQNEIVISAIDHEANIASWVQIAKWKGLTVKWWIPSRNTKTNPVLEAEDLKTLVGPKTRLACCTHTSNILGGIADIASLAKAIKQINPKTLFCVDAVAYAPHGPIDVKALGVDFYSFSWYKVYGPHIATLYASSDAQKQLESLGHFFKSGETLEEMLGLAGASYEAVQSIPKIVEYLDGVGWDAISKQEEEIQEVLLAYLRSKPDTFKIYGEPSADRNLRVPVISFRVRNRSSLSIIDAIESKSSFGCRSGHFYSKRLCKDVLGLSDPDDGVIRCSLLHYNSKEEVEGLVKVIETILTEDAGSSHVDAGRTAVADW